jgi:hypothetical protein
VWRTEGLEEPVVEEQFGAEIPGRTTLILPLVKKVLHTDLHPGEEKGEKTSIIHPN